MNEANLRVTVRGNGTVDSAGKYVLYWMTAARRATHNFGLDRAIAWAQKLSKPLVILEALRCDYQWASDRLHSFVLEGMADNARSFVADPVRYLSYVEPQPGSGRGLLKSLAERACVVVTDEFPSFFLPRMVLAAQKQIRCHFEIVDSCGLLPLRSSEKAAPTAYVFRRFLQRELPHYLPECPSATPFEGVSLPALESRDIANVLSRYPMVDFLAGSATKQLIAQLIAPLPIDHSVPKVTQSGGQRAGQTQWQGFLRTEIARYDEERNDPALDATSGLSPYLHFGHISVHEVVLDLLQRENWSPARFGTSAAGKREGFWNLSPGAEKFLDEIVTWRELGYHFCHHRSDYDQYDSLPDWARKTLDDHAVDEREHRYNIDEFARAKTHDPIWNAAQRQLLSEGRIHNYLRMLWGKKILQWTASPREALAVMIELNNRYALDGRNPNSYTGIFWVLGRFDRPWAPVRKIFGSVRYMTSESTARKYKLKAYLARYGTDVQLGLFR